MNIKSILSYFTYLKILISSPGRFAKELEYWHNSLTEPTDYYLNALRYFHFSLPPAIRAHKYYFSKEGRGFGEKAFHTMWFLLYKKYQFTNFLEIGIYRGQTMSLMGLISKMDGREITVHGISPFDSSPDIGYKYRDIDYIQDINHHFKTFTLKPPVLIQSLSTDIQAIRHISSNLWDCIYIDGSHEYDVAKQDWELCSRNIKKGGVIVLDDSALFTDYSPPFFGFKGFTGPSKVAEQIADDGNFKEVLRVGHNRVFEKVK